MRILIPIPITMRGVIEAPLLVNYRTRPDAVGRHVPPGLRLRIHEGWAFWNLVFCRVRHMRPLGAPTALGVTYSHVAYRLLVETTTTDGRVLSGLYFLRSDADSALIALPGAPLTDFRFHLADIEREVTPDRASFRVRTKDGEGDAEIEAARVEDPSDARPRDSVFETTEQARGFLKYTPLGLAPNDAATRVRLSEVFRDEQDWIEDVVRVDRARCTPLDRLDPSAPAFELATLGDSIDYRWRLGRTAPISGEPAREKTEEWGRQEQTERSGQ